MQVTLDHVILHMDEMYKFRAAYAMQSRDFTWLFERILISANMSATLNVRLGWLLPRSSQLSNDA